MNDANSAIEFLGIKLLGATPENGRKLLLTIAIIVAGLLIGWAARRLLRLATRGVRNERVRFWSRQAVSIAVALLLVIAVLSIWFDDPTRLATAIGLVAAGLAFALQRVITAIAGYGIILRGKTFNVGDRIVMGGVRGDVIGLSFMQTKIMEMGQPPPVDGAEPPIWVHSRQYTGRIVTVSNDKVFDEPVYNYTYHFPYVWEEMRLPVRYQDDRHEAETILLEAARRHGVKREQLSGRELETLTRRYDLPVGEIEPRVFWRLTDNWLELAVRFLSPDHGTRDLKDKMAREILTRLDEAGIGIASATYEITAVPPLKLQSEAPGGSG